METYPGWATIKDNMNIIDLAKLIKTVMYTGTQTQNTDVTYVEAE